MSKAASSLIIILASLVAGGCGMLSGGGPERDTSGARAAAPSKSRTPTASPTKTPESQDADNTARDQVPVRACDVVTSDVRATLGMTKAKNEHAAGQRTCDLSNTPERSSPSHFLFLKVTYNESPPALTDAIGYAKSYFAQRKSADFQHPNAFAARPTVTGTIGQTGSSISGKDFDEGYYVFYETDTAGAKAGNGLAVIRKRSVVITILASGTTIPGQRVVDGRPIGNQTAQRMIDKVADHVIRGVKRASES